MLHWVGLPETIETPATSPNSVARSGLAHGSHDNFATALAKSSWVGVV